MWRVILALQALPPVHLGVDHKKVVRPFSRFLSGVSRERSLELCTYGDLLILIADLIRKVKTLSRSLRLRVCGRLYGSGWQGAGIGYAWQRSR